MIRGGRSLKKHKTGMSRREFSRNLALIAAATAAVPAGTAIAKETPTSTAKDLTPSQETEPSPEGEAQYQTILSRYGSRLSDEQKADARRLVGAAQETGKTMRSFKLENWNEPAPIFRVYVAAKRVEDGK